MCRHANPRTLSEIEAALGRNHLAERDHEAAGFDLDDILLEREHLYIERDERMRLDPLDPDEHPIGYADAPPAILEPATERITRIHLLALRIKTRIANDALSVAEIDTAIDELDALCKELGLPRLEAA